MHYIACYGDSLIQGFPYGPKYSWTAQVEQLTQLKMLNYGICGECCDDIVFRVRQYALPAYVKHILFLGGANDILQGRKLEAVMDDYKRLLAFCEEKQYQLCIVLPFISADAYLNRQLLNLKQELVMHYAHKALLLDVQSAIGLDAGARKKAYLDGVHPLAKVYTAIGEYAAPILQKWVDDESKRKKVEP